MKLTAMRIADYKAHKKWQKDREAVRRTFGYSPSPEVQENLTKHLEQMDAMNERRVRSPHYRNIADALSEANGKAFAHTYNSPQDVVDLAYRAEELLDKHGVPQNKRRNCTAVAYSGVPTSRAYARSGRSAVATKVVLLRVASLWYVTNVERCERYTGPGGAEKFSVGLTDVAREAVIANALSDFN